jgi:signal transduction histidine kinase
MREVDWTASALGPVEKWPQALKTAVRIMLTSRQAMFVWWGNDLINLYNDAYRSILGGKHPRALGLPAEEVWREIWDEVGPRARSAMRENEGTYDEALELIMERNGYPEETYYTFSYSPVPNDEGDTGGILCANTDDTVRIIGERRLALLRDLAARTADARSIETACRVSADCLETNPRDLPFSLIYLVDSERKVALLKGRSGIAAGHNAAPESIRLDGESPWPLAEVLATNQPVITSGLRQRFGDLPSGAWQQPPEVAVSVPIAGAGQAAHAGVLIAGLNPFRPFGAPYRDFLSLISNQLSAAIGNAHAYEQEKKRAEALAELDRAKTTFFSNVSHEFRTPLMLMMAPVEEALTDDRAPLPAAQRERLELVERNGQRMLKLVNTLLDFARIEAGRVEAAYERTNIGEYTAELASLFRSAVERAGMELVVQCRSGIDNAWIDREMWEKIVLNLISNAFKFTFEGRIRVSVAERDGKAVLEVEDTGTGIPADQIGRVFERFHRIEGARGRTFEGTGIGLALVQELTRLHGGGVNVTSQEGVGSTFRVEIPLGREHLPADRILADRSPDIRSSAVDAYVAEALRWLPGDGALQFASDGDLPMLGTRTRAENSSERPRVLLADDNPDMREYVSRLLSEQYEIEAVPNGKIALQAIERQRPDVVLSDVMMPELDGFGLVRAIRANSRLKTLPVILLSARAGEEATVEGLAQGADDYLVKPFAARELKARLASCLKLSRLRSQLVEVLESITDGFIALDSEWRYTYVNHVAAAMGRKSPEELLGTVLFDEFPETKTSGLRDRLEEAARLRQPSRFEYYYAPYDAWTEWHTYPTREGISAFVYDVTLKKRLDDQLRQSAKLESLGVLAGGVAHDFNNLLVGILGNASLAEEILPESHPVRPLLRDTVRAGERAAELTQQLLAYSGKGRFIVEPVSLADLVRDNQVLLKTSIAGNVQLKLDLPDGLPPVQADRAQMQQVVMNLMINAAEAIGAQPGEVRVTLRETEIEGTPALKAGRYVSLEVKDNGCGMSPETLKKIFDPFFTTKFTGRGLGLAAVQGIVRAHQGAISVESAPGQGTLFRVLLPVAPGSGTRPGKPAAQNASHGSGTVLIIDDEDAVRSTASLALQARGYRTLTAENGREGIAVFERDGDLISAVILDMTMPVMTGEQTLPVLKRLRQRVPVILSSGFAESEVAPRFAGLGADGFLHKPYTAATLAKAVQDAIARQRIQ